ncbi:MAG: hypothetical protein JWO46_3371, partial [Nocardioidaceae bacterium]|nr:hypothetical protein [Nocardioidaceae bacterium]
PAVMTEAVRRIAHAWAGLDGSASQRPAHDVVVA